MFRCAATSASPSRQSSLPGAWREAFRSRIVHLESHNKAIYSLAVVVYDSLPSPLVVALLLKIPSIVVLNKVKLLLSPRLRKLTVSRIFESMVGELLGSMWAMADRVLVP